MLGLRFLPTDKTLWHEYIKLEVGWVEALRRRWKVLGIDLAGDTEDAKKMEADVQAGLPRPDSSAEEPDLGQNAFGESGEAARKAIISGDLVITVLRSAFSNSSLGTDLEFHLQLVALFRRYPTGLRPRLLECVYEHMQQEPTLKWNPVARRTILERTLFDAPYDPEADAKRSEGDVVVQGEELVAELGKVVKALRAPVGEAPEGWTRTWNEEVGMWLLRWADRMSDNQDLVSRFFAWGLIRADIATASVPGRLDHSIDETRSTTDRAAARETPRIHHKPRATLSRPSITRQTPRPREIIHGSLPFLPHALDPPPRDRNFPDTGPRRPGINLPPRNDRRWCRTGGNHRLAHRHALV